MGSQNSTGSQPVCLLDAENSNRCTEENPVISYVKHLDDDKVEFKDHAVFDQSTFRKIGDQLVSKNVLQETVSDGKCFKVSRELEEGEDDQAQVDDAANWLCADDLENYWEKNCLVILPAITTCMDEMAILKLTADAERLETALDYRRALEQTGSDEVLKFYDFDFLAQLFVGRCIKIDGKKYCPSESIHVSEIDQSELLKQKCRVFDDIVTCQHDLRESLEGGKCLLAGLTYVCEDDISQILEQKCIEINYEGTSNDTNEAKQQTKKVCGRELIDFLNGYPIGIQDGNNLSVVTGNDLTMLSAQCLLVDGHELCWQNEPVAKPYYFIDHRCKVDSEDQKVHCLGPRFL